jgi:hypothetical protein
MGKKIPTWWENKFYFMTRNYIFRRVDEGIERCCFFLASKNQDYTPKPHLSMRNGGFDI